MEEEVYEGQLEMDCDRGMGLLKRERDLARVKWVAKTLLVLVNDQY